MHPITIRYTFRPRTRSLATGQVCDLFGLTGDDPPHAVADGVALDILPGDLVLFTGPSGSGKSSLLRAAGAQLGAADAHALELPDVPLIDAMSGPVESRLEQLAACGLSEARLLLRTPAELSDGQRYRFRLALALDLASGERQPVESCDPRGMHETRRADARRSPFLLADEFAAVLDRTLAKVLAFNLRKLVTRTGIGALLATTHEDLIDDLNPDLHIRCLGDGHIEIERRDVKKKYLVRPRLLALERHPRRLAALRSVALSQSRPRIRQTSRPVVAWVRAGRNLRLQHSRCQSDASIEIFRTEESTLRRRAVGAERAALGAVAGGAASDLPRRGHRGGIRATSV
jgi:ABC-type transporter Mla maintaining outer membrane lipid asymmetry ATPase subunit MlaF